MTEPVEDGRVANDWDVEHVVIFSHEGGGRDRVELVRIDPAILVAAEGGDDVSLRSIQMVVGRAFRVRPTRLVWGQLTIFPRP